MNVDYGLPNWRDLLVRLLADSRRLRVPANSDEIVSSIATLLREIVPDPLLQAAVARQAYARPEHWFAAIREHLRPASPELIHNERFPLAQIAKAIVFQHQARPEQHVAVLTFNYDDLLETAIERRLTKEKIDPGVMVSVSREEEYPISLHRAGIFIYHLHGFVRHVDNLPILDAASYVKVLVSPGRHWSWNCMNTYLLHRDSAAMFLGLSLTDPSLRLLLSHSAEKGLPLSGVYITNPFPILEPQAGDGKPRDLQLERDRAYIARDVLHLFDEVLEELSLVPYHVSAWPEITEILEEILKWASKEKATGSSSTH